MKKFVLAMAVFLGVAGTSGNALAYFEEMGVNGGLILSIYNPDNNQVSIDLGPVNDVIGLQNTIVAPAGSWNINSFPGLTLADLNVAAQAADVDRGTGRPQSYNLFFGLNSPETPEIASTKTYVIFANATQMMLNTCRYSSDEGQLQIAEYESADDNSYYWRMVGNGGNFGSYAGLNSPLNEDVEGDMGLVETQGYVDLYLFNYLRVLQTATTVNPTDPVAVIRVMADGSVVMNPTVPLPGSLVLLSSGLLGMIGIRRKNA